MVWAPSGPSPLLPSPPEPIPCGREGGSLIANGPGGMTTSAGSCSETPADQPQAATARPTWTDLQPPLHHRDLDRPLETPKATPEGGPLPVGLDPCSSAPALVSTGASQACSTGGEGGQGEARATGQSWPRPCAWLPSCSLQHPGSRVSTGMTLLIPANPALSCSLAPVVSVGVHVHTLAHTGTCTHTWPGATPHADLPSCISQLCHIPCHLPPHQPLHVHPHMLLVTTQKAPTSQMALKRPQGCCAPTQSAVPAVVILLS